MSARIPTVGDEPSQRRAQRIPRPRNMKWSELTTSQRVRMVIQGGVQLGLLAAALIDIRRPADRINGSKRLWTVVAFANFLGIGPIAYFVFGRKH